jgi:glutaredoxin
MASVTVELMGKPGCHLCDDARVIVRGVLEEFPGVDLVERNILEDAEMFETMKNDIPVVLINGQRHSTWRVDADALRQAVTEELA